MLKLLPQPRSWLRPFDIAGKRFFGSRPKAFKDAPSASKPDKRHGGFFLFFFFTPLHFAFLFHSSSRSQSEGPRLRAENTFQMQTLRPLSLSFLCAFPLPRRLALCLPCDVCPSPTGLYPLCAPKGLRACCCSLKRLGEKFGATHSKEKKSSSLWGGGVPPGQ